MFVRDSNNNPREISRIFVRDAAGNPQEISKIYVRDAAGNPRLVFDNTTVVVPTLCPTCTSSTDNIIPFYVLSNSNWSTPKSIVTFTSNMGLTTPISPGSQCPSTLAPGGQLTPESLIDKDYWSKVSVPTGISSSNESPDSNTSSVAPNLTTRSFNLPSTGFCSSVGTPPASWVSGIGVGNYWTSLRTAFNSVNNYPAIPGHIIVDWNTFTIRDTFYMVMKLPQKRFKSYCASNGSEIPVACPTSGLRGASLYPFYNKSILTRRILDPNGDPDFDTCGQEYCKGMYGTTIYDSMSNCAGGYWESGIYVDTSGNVSIGDCADSGGTGSVHGSIPNVFRCPCCDCVENPGGCPGFPTCCTHANSTWCDCKIFFNSTTTEAEDNPFSFIVAREDTGTGRTIPTVTETAEPQDCCISTCYGPIDLVTPTPQFELKACRQVYQIPPINSLDPANERLGFFQDIATSMLMNSEGIGGGSQAAVRITLPCYVTLDSIFDGDLVYVTPSRYDNFINNGSGPASTQERSVWNAIRGVLGVTPGVGGLQADVPFNDLIWLSSSSFYYNEKRSTEETAPFDRVPTGLSVTTNGFPSIWWSFNGYPTEISTHYVVFELNYTSTQTCVSDIFDIKWLRDPRNQQYFTLGIKFYPLRRKCGTLKPYHPLFQNFIIPKDIQDNVAANNGTVDYYAGFVNQNALTNDQGGNTNPGVWYNADAVQSTSFTQNNFWTYIHPTTFLSQARCLKYQPIGTYANFLTKYYQPSIISTV
jgi:hypothetical protein